MNLSLLAWRQSWRDLRAGELNLLIVSVVLAVAALTAVAFFADRLDRALQRDARQLMGGDAVVVSDQRPDPRWAAWAAQGGLSVVETASFPSMARAPDERGGEARLVALKAVTAHYPLHGQMVLQGPDGGRLGPTQLQPGQAWVEPGVLDALGLSLGDTLELGDLRLTLAAVIAAEPDRGAGFMSFAPRVMIAMEDLAATGLVQPASRITWRVGVAGSEAAVLSFERQVQRTLEQEALRGVRLDSLEGGRPEMRQTLDRAQRFLDLVALMAALLCAVAIGNGARDFAQKHLDDCALMRVLGLSYRQLATIYVLEYLGLGLVACAIGLGLGWAAHHVFVWVLADLVNTQLPSAGWRPVALAWGAGMSLLAAFGLPPLVQLARVPALRVIRRDLGLPSASSGLTLALGLLGFGALLVGVARDLTLGAIAVGGFAVAGGVVTVLALTLLSALRRLVERVAAPRWLILATRQVAARPLLTSLQVAALTLGLLALLLLVVMRTSLVDSWRAATPPDAPNRFAINIQPDQAQAFREVLRAQGVMQYDFYPMIRGRLVAINGRTVQNDQFEGDRAQRLVEREFNLSHAAQLPGHNQIVAGAWRAQEPDALSVEEGLAKTLGLKLGDRLRFDMAGQAVEGRITNLRKVDWASMRVNFFVMFPLAEMPDVPRTWISAFRAPAGRELDRQLSRGFPNVTVVDVSASLDQVQRVLDKVIQAVEFLFVFTLLAGLVVLMSATVATRGTREREYALMRAFGASTPLLRQVQTAEMLGVGLLAGLLAAALTLAGAWSLARWVFEFEWGPAWWALPLGGATGAVLAWGAGAWSLRGVLRRPVVQTLRQATAE